MSFRRIRDAAEIIKAPPDCFYPHPINWHEFHVDQDMLTDIQNRFNKSSYGKIALLGPHGCGKTFFLLYLGFWWEASDYPNRLSFYAREPSMLSPEEVCKQWGQKFLRDRPCLWIIDDIHNDYEGILYYVVELFEELALRGWWLILAGWGLPFALQNKWLGEDHIEWKLTPQTVTFALSYKKSEFANDRDLINELVARGAGLMQILWAATERPDILRNRNFEELDRACEARILSLILPKAPEQRAILARLKLLGLPFVARNPEESALLQSGQGVQQIKHPLTGYELSSDAIAQILLKAEVSSAGTQEELMNSFLKPLRPYIRDLLQQGVLTLPGKVFQSLRSSSSVKWLSGKLAGDGKQLIKEFLNEELLEAVRIAVIKLLEKEEVRCSDLFDVARTIVTIEPYARAWAQETANAILQAKGRDQLLALFRSEITPRDRLRLWRSLEALARLGGDVELKEALVQAVEDKSLQNAFSLQEINLEQGKILREAKRADERAYRVLLEARCKSLAEEIRKVPPRGVWSRLRALTKWEPSKAIEILGSLGLDSTSSLIFAAPHAARAFLAEFKGKEERRRLKKLFREAIQHRRISKEDVQQWASARDLGSFVYLSRCREVVDVDILFQYVDRVAQETSPALIADVSREVARYAQTSRLRKYLADRMLESIQQGKDPLIERLGALERLNNRLLTLELLEGAIRQWREFEPQKLFQLLYLLMARGAANLGERLAREIINDWQLILATPHPLGATALAGLCLFVLGDEAAEFSLPLNQLPRPSTETKPPTDPLETACQILALAKKVPEPGAPGYANLEWLIEQVMRPSRDYLRNWHRLTVPRRRLSLAILFAGLRELQERRERKFTQLASQLASSIGDPCQDDIWDNDLIARLEAVRMGVGHQAALNLLKRCCNRWGEIIQKKILRSRDSKAPSQEAIKAALQILRHVVALAARSKDDLVKDCAKSLLDATASRMPGERQEEIKDLQNQLMLGPDDTLPTTPSVALPPLHPPGPLNPGAGHFTSSA
jgi:hypothetical protein